MRRFLNKDLGLIATGFLLSLILVFFTASNEVNKSSDSSELNYRATKSVQVPQIEIWNTETGKKIKFEGAQKVLWSKNGSAFMPSSEIHVKQESHHLLSIPTSVRWKAPLQQGMNATSIRYFAVGKNKERSAISYQTIFHHSSELKRVSLFIDEDDFFDFFRGIYVRGVSELKTDSTYQTSWWDQPANYHQRGKEWQRNAFFQFYSANDELLCESPVKVAINGNATRAYPIKSLRVKAEKKILYPFFKDRNESIYSSLVLRNSGNDFERTYFADAFAHYLSGVTCETELVDRQSYEPVILYLNGAYWGIHNLRERLDDKRLADKYKVDKKKVSIVEGLEWKEGSKKQAEQFETFYLQFLKNKTIGSEELNQFKKQVNYENYLHYLSIQLYCANTDWPANNVKCFKINDKSVYSEKQKWNYVMWDMDYAFAYTGNVAVNTDMFKHLTQSNAHFAKMFSLLMTNTDFKNDLKKSLLQFLNHDKMKDENLILEVEQFASTIRNEIPNHINRWRYPVSIEKWEKHVKDLNAFLIERKKVLITQVKNYL